MTAVGAYSYKPLQPSLRECCLLILSRILKQKIFIKLLLRYIAIYRIVEKVDLRFTYV